MVYMMIKKDAEMNEIFDATVELCNILKDNYYKNNPLKDYNADCNFVIEPGNKYLKIVMNSSQTSVHAFVDKATGDLYKAASWRAPAKGVRFNILKDMGTLRNCADWVGSYLYR